MPRWICHYLVPKYFFMITSITLRQNDSFAAQPIVKVLKFFYYVSFILVPETQSFLVLLENRMKQNTCFCCCCCWFVLLCFCCFFLFIATLFQMDSRWITQSQSQSSLKMSRVPQTIWDPWIRPCNSKKDWVMGLHFLNLGNGLVWDLGNRVANGYLVFSRCRDFHSSGLNLDSSKTNDLKVNWGFKWIFCNWG